MRCRLACLLLVVPAVLVAAPVPPEARVRDAYGVWLDPDKDCKYEVRDGKLRVAIPDAHHSMYPNPGKWNAPRLWREVEGDFTVTVRVSFPIRSAAPTADESRLAFAAGGLIAWAGDDDHVRVVRREHTSNGQPEEWFGRFPPYLGGKGERIAYSSGQLPGEAAYLRLERRGDKITSGHSRDRSAWYEFAAVAVKWGEKVRVGVVAENGYNAPFAAEFDEYTLTVHKK
jgi:hypothetical protein